MLYIYTDGASRDNPGPAACAFILMDENEVIIHSEARFLGETTNNVAEYTAVILALMKARDLTKGEVCVYSDSQLVIRQVTGVYRIHKPHLKDLCREALSHVPSFEKVYWRHVPRSNPGIQICDRLCNEELDKQREMPLQSSDRF